MPNTGSPPHSLEVLLKNQNPHWAWPCRGLMLSPLSGRSTVMSGRKTGTPVPGVSRASPKSSPISCWFLVGTWTWQSCADGHLVCVCQMNGEWIDVHPRSVVCTQKRRVMGSVSSSCPQLPASPSHPVSCRASRTSKSWMGARSPWQSRCQVCFCPLLFSVCMKVGIAPWRPA